LRAGAGAGIFDPPAEPRMTTRLYRERQAYFEPRSVGELFFAPIDVILSPRDILQPDLVLVADPRQISNRGIEGAPLLVIEVLSPTTRERDRRTKMRRHGELGVPHCWLVDPEERRLECYLREGDSYRLVVGMGPGDTFGHPSWPDLTLDLTSLWG
jgi:Uma2 family endonuclease